MKETKSREIEVITAARCWRSLKVRRQTVEGGSRCRTATQSACFKAGSVVRRSTEDRVVLPREVEPLFIEGRTVPDCLEEERERRSGGFL